MKRAAESQLTKDNVDDEDDSQEPTTGIQKADPSALSDRIMRSLPKRSLSAVSPTMPIIPEIPSSNGATKTPQQTEPVSRFSAFTGFGSSTASAFTFTSPLPQANTNAESSQPTSTAVEKPLDPEPTFQPSKGISLFTTSNLTPPSTPPSSISESDAKRDAAYKYCVSLRGLNTSFLNATTLAIQADPFVDITEMLENYKTLRSSIQKALDDALSTVSCNPINSSVPAMAPSSKAPSMPIPPKSFFGLGNDARAVESSQLHTSGFTPKQDYAGKESPSGFTWPIKTGTSDKPVSFHTAQSLTPSHERSSGSKSTLGDDDAASTEPKMSATSEKVSNGQDEFQGETSASSSFTFKPSTPAVPLTPGLSSFLGSSKAADDVEDASTLSPLTKSSASNPSPPSPSGFGFGTGKNSNTSNPFPFGKGSIGNPVGFPFGSPPTNTSDAKPPETSDTAPETESKVGSEGADGSLSTHSHDSSPVPLQGSIYDADGPGEEDEVTLHETKAQAYKMTATGDKKGFVSAGKGQLKLKGRADAKRRILMRNSSTGHIILNFNLFPGFNMNVDAARKVISFRVPGEDEAAAVYQLRVPSEAEVVNWQKAIQKEVDGLLPSHDT